MKSHMRVRRQKVNVEVHDGRENYDLWQLKPWNLVIEKMETVAVSSPVELEAGSVDILAPSLARMAWPPRLCAHESFLSPGVMETSLIITAGILEEGGHASHPYPYPYPL